MKKSILNNEIKRHEKTQEALRESKEFSASLIASMQDGFSVLDTNGIHIDVNPALCQMTGFSREELIGVGLPHPYWAPEANEEIEQALQKALQGEFAPLELTFMRKNGERFPVIVSPSWVKDKQGNVISYFATVKDITERKQAEEEIQRLADVVRNMQVGLHLYHLEDIDDDRTLRMVATNPAAAQLTGVAMEDVLGKTLDENFPGLREKGIPQLYAEVVRTGKPVEIEELYYGDVRVIHGVFSMKAFPLPNNHVGVVFENITERKQAEEALKASEARFRELFNNMSSGVAVYEAIENGKDFVFKDLNRGGEWISRVNKDDVIGKRVTEFFPGVKEFGLFEVFQRVFRTGEPERHPVSLYKDKRLSHWAENYVYKLPSREIVAVYDDVTERKQAEEALRERERQYREQQAFLESIYNEVDTAIFVVDVKDGDFFYADNNKAHQRTSGLKSKDLVGKTPEGLIPRIPPEVAAAVRANYQRCLDLGKTIEYEEKIIIGGRDIWSLTSLTPLKDERDQVYRIVGISTDITERVQMEEQLRAALREREALLREVHHRVKNNLQVICSLLDLQSALESEQSRQAFQESRNRVRSMAQIHEQLTYAENLAQVDMTAYIQELVGSLGLTYGAGPIAITIEVTDVTLPFDSVSPCGLLINELVSNAMKHAFPPGIAVQGGGEIRIALRLLPTDENQMELIVSDNGVGPSEDMELEKPTSLGLTLVNLLVKQLQGTLEVERDKGTTFRVVFTP